MKISTIRKALMVLALMIAVAIPAAALSGSGTSSDPYVITSAEELKNMTGSACYKLGNDIVINDVSAIEFTDGVVVENSGDEWTPIENFSGTFDGAGYYITGLYVAEDNANGGLFGTLTNATIKSVNIEFALIESDEYAGILAAKAEGTTTITDCMVSGSVIGKTTKEMNTVGGLVGYLGTDATISQSVSYATVTGATSYSANVGGLVGLNNGTVTTSGYYGNVIGTATYYDAAIGGIAGYNTGSIDNCRVVGKIGGESTAMVNDCYVGGVIGLNKGTVENCENGAEVSAENYSSGDSIVAAGGIVGATIDADVADNTNNGAVSGKYAYVGGIAGIAVSDSGVLYIECNNNTGAVNSEYGVAGGIVGRAVAAGEGYVSIKLYIQDCYNSGVPTGNANGELAGETATVDSASVTIGAEASAANANTCSALGIFKINAEAVQYGSTAEASATKISGSGAVGSKAVVDTDKSQIKVIRYKKRTAFVPAPVVVELTVIADENALEILDVDASGLTYANGRISGNVVVKIYRPKDNTTAYPVVVGTSVENKFADVDFGVITDEDRITYVTVPVDCEAEAGKITVNAMVVNDTDTMKPLCENKEVEK